ncbi:asparaginase domain-containing protein [Moraxella oblonga]|uniref:asparaginase domain-containing protein n=1 Tax=Moraxella oblonga TaxID=200413 RepID=UPI000834D682|nr:asparaginase domain-containing protein [Moraxella oblonga]
MTTSTHLIYAGGTFGSHGVPLSPLSAEVFLPVLTKLVNQRCAGTLTYLDNSIVKDSSALTPNDFVHFYTLIRHAYEQGKKRFVLITGTDSLSFLASFLANAFDGFANLSLIITGSMSPLLVSDNPDFTINDDSDAWQNLTLALNNIHQHGVFVAFGGQVFLANNTQKIHSQDSEAFVGDTTSTKPPKHLPVLPNLDNLNSDITIKSIYLLPNQTAQLADELTQAQHAQAVILIAFGAGNLPKSDECVLALQALHQQKIPVVCTSMCAFGGVNANYEAGAWQYKHGVWSGENLSVAGIYGKLLWLILTGRLTLDEWVKS